MAEVETVVGQHFPEVLPPVKAALAVAAVGCLQDNTQPTTLIFVAPASAGKSMGMMFLMPRDDDALTDYFYRSDKFTAASFVSHRADLSPDQLKEVDLLPRLNGKTLLTKELAPMFTGKRDELTERFAVLTSVLDGQGFVSDSGAQGRRGYDQPINFQWLGATTPLSPEVLGVMAQLGPRMLFFDADRPRKDTEALVALGRAGDWEASKRKCRRAVHGLLRVLYRDQPPGSMRGASVMLAESALRRIALWAQVVVQLRAAGTLLSDEEEPAEHPERVLGLLRSIAIGSALVHGRAEVVDDDLALVAHIALSSGVAGRQRVFRGLLRAGGPATVPEVATLAGVSTPTAQRYVDELQAVGLSGGTRGIPAHAEVAESFAELRGTLGDENQTGGRERPRDQSQEQ